VLAADEVWRLQGGKDHRAYRSSGGDDAECISFQRMAAKGHYGPGGGTKQGIYVCTSTGEFLASVNSTNPAVVTGMLRRGLSAWAELPEAKRSAKSTLSDPGHRWEASYPQDGLVLEQTFRELTQGLDPADGFNRDFAWFSAEEARRLLPESLEPGANYPVPRALHLRFARHHLLASAHGETGGFAPHEVEGALEVEVLAVEDSKVRVRITGTSTAKADPPKAGEDLHWRSQQVEARLLGFATFDRRSGRFDAFELMAEGKVTPRGSEDSRPLGWFFALADGDRPSARVSPTHAYAYDADWLVKPKLTLHALAAPRVITNSIGMQLATVPAGSFSMGSAGADGDEHGDEQPQHRVRLTTSIFMGVHEVTQDQYEQVMGLNPSDFAPGGKCEDLVVGLETGSLPVERVKGTDAIEFCSKLSELPEEKAAGRVYRLPTEAEWEYACRAGTTTDFAFGGSLSSLQANFNGGLASPGAERGPFLGRPTTVGSYRPNGFGLYDMNGNVSEWCLDQYGAEYYAASPSDDPTGPAAGSGRVFRGGAWGNDAASCRSAYRDHSIDAYGYQTRGFRVILERWQGLPVDPPTPADEFDQVFQDKVRPFLGSYCFECHSGPRPKGDFSLDVYEHATDVATIGRKRWKQVQDKLLAGTMPPEKADQPPREDVEFARRWAEDALATLRYTGRLDPGHETIRRLNRAEYENTIRDLLGVEFKATEAFPTDDVGAGGASLSLAPLQMEKYVAAARRIAGQAAALAVGPDPAMPPDEAIHVYLTDLVSRAYRRPAAEQEVARLSELAKQGLERDGSFEAGIAAALEAVLVSPHFLFKVELDSHPDDPMAVRSLNDHELATRMSYLIWSSMPDDELTGHARDGTLDGSLDSQVLRMLADPRARALSEHFAGQWLQLGRLDEVEPDPQLFPEFDQDLLEDMRRETRMFLAAIVAEDRSLLDLVDADFTFVSGRLARFYGISDVRGEGFRRVTLDGDRRGGLLTQASILTLTSNPNRTSPVKRGKWVLENILGAPPAAPPPGVSALDERALASGSLREQLEHHRRDASCAACHARMDALGFAFENFDPIGRWRTRDGAHSIDPSGTLPGGRRFDGAAQLQALLRTDLAPEFLRCLTEETLAYALGRELEYFDEPAVRGILDALDEGDHRFSILVRGVVRSEPFRKRRGWRGEAL
jgi:formylglycine-generating enzyme required for sulfatase activity